MKFERLGVVLLLAAVFLSGGCANFVAKDVPTVKDVSVAKMKDVPAAKAKYVPGVERRFSAALQFMRTGSESAARDQLESIVEEPPLVGVTDEALFRLAVFNLGDENGKGETRARKLLERLTAEFPASSWSRQAAPLMEYIRETAALRSRMRELKSLRNQNLSLSRDNKDLRQSLEHLKNLDLELEQKIRK